MKRNAWIYSITLICVGLIFVMIHAGEGRFESGPIALAAQHAASWRTHLDDPLAVLLIQIVVVIMAARGVGALFTRIGQPAVVGEIVAGVLLGPSLLGAVAPAVMTDLFPKDSLGSLRLLAEVGVLLFMFCVGAEVDGAQMRKQAGSSIVISHASIAFPFMLGVGLALLEFQNLAPPAGAFTGFALFMGISMSITAFPVLARILAERGLLDKPIGQSALGCAAVDDVTAWCLLALVIAIAQAGGMAAATRTVLLAGGFVAGMLFVVRPAIARMANAGMTSDARRNGFVAVLLVLAFAAAGFTEISGIRPYFGAFVAGVIVPADADFRAFLRRRIEPVCSIVLMPLFFAFTGLRTQIGLISGTTDLPLIGLIMAVAISGKVLGAMIPARACGMSWREAFTLGALMNTRGLMELVVLNVGFDMGLLTPRLFTMMVLMALLTTFLTAPLLSLVYRKPAVADGLVTPAS